MPSDNLQPYLQIFLSVCYRRKVTDTPGAKKVEASSADSASSDSRSADKADVVKKPWEKPSSISRVNSAPKTQEKSPVSPASAAPLSRTRPGSSTGGDSGSRDGSDLEKFKEEILEEMRKELQKTKDEIISALIEELQKSSVV